MILVDALNADQVQKTKSKRKVTTQCVCVCVCVLCPASTLTASIGHAIGKKNQIIISFSKIANKVLNSFAIERASIHRPASPTQHTESTFSICFDAQSGKISSAVRRCGIHFLWKSIKTDESVAHTHVSKNVGQESVREQKRKTDWMQFIWRLAVLARAELNERLVLSTHTHTHI